MVTSALRPGHRRGALWLGAVFQPVEMASVNVLRSKMLAGAAVGSLQQQLLWAEATGRKCSQAGASLGCFAFVSRCDGSRLTDVLDVTPGARAQAAVSVC